MKPLPFDPARGYPAGRRIVYRCTRCGAFVESYPTRDEPSACTCGNIRIDPDAGRCSVRDHASFELLERDVFGERLPALTWDELDQVGRVRAAIAWAFTGRETPIDQLLATLVHHEVRIGLRTLAWWELGGDAGLLFDGDHVIGQAIQAGFVCADREVWEQLAAAASAPPSFSWELDDELSGRWVRRDGGDVWLEGAWEPPPVFAPPDVPALVREVEASRHAT